jgi:2-C-methyl-D-erythritol 2,4-cyclodiphosphate synthase
MIRRVISSVIKYGACVPGIAASSTYKICNHDSFVISTPDRSSLYEIQTPQGFRAGLILSAAKKAATEHIECTDDAGLLEYCNIPVKVIPGSINNIKLTYPEDIVRAKAILKGGQASLRIGMGFDVHQLVPDRRLILCGTEVPFELGLLGHSDADVALHALMDAMLGSCGLGDIGKFFPDSDNQWKDASSMDLLKRVNQIINDAGFSVCNADITIVAQKPKLLPFIPDMTRNIQDVLDLSDHLINVKATTTEHLGFEGRMEGISAYAVCFVKENN